MLNKFNFQGAYAATIDAKNRLLVPADHREKLKLAGVESDGFVVNIAASNRIWLFAQSYYPEVVREAEAEAGTDEEVEWVRYHYLGNSVLCPKDGQNRILLPGEMLQETNTGREVHVLGMGDHLELWNSSDWVEHSRKVRGNAFGRLGLRHRRPGTPQVPFAGQGPSTTSS